MRFALRATAAVMILVLIGYLGISWKYADGVTKVTRDKFATIAESMGGGGVLMAVG